MVAGHTKFSPDRLFAQVANSYNNSDVFTIEELRQICSLHAATSIDDGSAVLQWREATCQKYSDLPGTRKYHDFLVARSVTGVVAMKVKEKCYGGSFVESPLSVLDESAIGYPTLNYRDTHTRPLTDEKMKNMITMYDKFVPPNRRPDYLPPFRQSATSLQGVASTSSANVALTSSLSFLPSTTTGRKRSHCQCGGSGHKNKARCNEGHTTRAGCPKIH